ncbi:MAG: hypothetical protein AVDCRST_MAG96-4182, partial [uncultured Segetibacter sp.]
GKQANNSNISASLLGGENRQQGQIFHPFYQ